MYAFSVSLRILLYKKMSYTQRHLKIHSGIKAIIILSDVIPSGELVVLQRKKKKKIPGVVRENTGGGTDIGQVKYLGQMHGG